MPESIKGLHIDRLMKNNFFLPSSNSHQSNHFFELIGLAKEIPIHLAIEE